MIRTALIAFTLLCEGAVQAQDSSLRALTEVTQTYISKYQLFRTTTPQTFLKLNTTNGQIFAIQHNNKKEGRMTIPFNESKLIGPQDSEVNGRFTLLNTEIPNIYILFDQINGKAWQIEWATDIRKRKVLEIPL